MLLGTLGCAWLWLFLAVVATFVEPRLGGRYHISPPFGLPMGTTPMSLSTKETARLEKWTAWAFERRVLGRSARAIGATISTAGGDLRSALEHYSYCPRQYALIHREQTFDENVYTLKGRADHERVDDPDTVHEEGVRVERSLPLWSATVGLIGKADVVEVRDGVPYPVEYKHGRRKPDRHADLQVCAQAMCLEEMLGVEVPRGAVYHVSSRQRREVVFTSEMRERVRQAVTAIRRINAQERLPPPVADARCPPCSLVDSCMPSVGANQSRLRAAYRRLYVLEHSASGPDNGPMTATGRREV